MQELYQPEENVMSMQGLAGSCSQKSPEMNTSIGAGSSEIDTRSIQVGGDHYKDHKIQPWDYIVDHKFDYWQGNILKYISRWREKGGLRDLRKCRHFLDHYIGLVESNDPSIRW